MLLIYRSPVESAEGTEAEPTTEDAGAAPKLARRRRSVSFVVITPMLHIGVWECGKTSSDTVVVLSTVVIQMR